jgi:hypothetical protein
MTLAIAVILVAYMVLHAPESFWKLGVLTPVIMDAEGIGPRTRQLERRIEIVEARLCPLVPGDKNLLRLILDAGEMTSLALYQTSEFDKETLDRALPKLSESGLALVKTEVPPGHDLSPIVAKLMAIRTYRINPALLEAVFFVLEHDS